MAGSTQIDAEAPFSGAFSGKSDGWKWVSNVIGVGASFGILTSLLVAMLGQARYMCVIGRSSVVPAWFARVHPKTSTPVNASAFLGTVFYFVYTRFLVASGYLYFSNYLLLYFLHRRINILFVLGERTRAFSNFNFSKLIK